MAIMKGFAKEGKSILFITHKLDEIMQVADRCTVLRKGKCIGTVETKDTTKEELSRMMVGRDISFSVDKKPAEVGDVVFSVKNLTVVRCTRGRDMLYCRNRRERTDGAYLCADGT